jgi:predicted HTH domain antitoxin
MDKASSDSQILPWIEESANPNSKTLIGKIHWTSQAISQSEEQYWISFIKNVLKLKEPELSQSEEQHWIFFMKSILNLTEPKLEKPLLSQQFLNILITQKFLEEPLLTKEIINMIEAQSASKKDTEEFDKAFELYKQERISLGKAAELCGLYYDEMLAEIKKRELNFFFGPRTLEEAKKGEEVIDKYMRKRKEG